MRYHLNMVSLAIAAIFGACGVQAQEYKVGITDKMPYVDVTHDGQKVRIQRIQDQGNKLIDDFAKTSRPCPPFCIHPIKADPDVETFGELELMNFMTREVKAGTGVIVDARLPEFYRVETIPTAVNIPFTLIKPENPRIERVLLALGARKSETGMDFRGAKTVALFCNGPWCDQSSRAIQALLKLGYPAEKLKYYRDGMQLWRVLGLTTVVPAKAK